MAVKWRERSFRRYTCASLLLSTTHTLTTVAATRLPALPPLAPAPLTYLVPRVPHTQVFFVPGSGGKNNLVIGLIDVFGEWPTFAICVFMLWFWMRIFDRYYKRRWPKDSPGGCVVGHYHTHSPTPPPPPNTPLYPPEGRMKGGRLLTCSPLVVLSGCRRRSLWLLLQARRLPAAPRRRSTARGTRAATTPTSSCWVGGVTPG